MKDNKYIDISFPYCEGMAIYPNNPRYTCKRVSDMRRGDPCNVSQITIGTHTGTHLDAPLHFVGNGMAIDEIPLERINGKAKVLEITGQVITISGLGQYLIEEDDIILFRTNNSDVFENNNVLDSYVTLDYETAHYLVDKGVKMIGIDYMTIERPKAMREYGKSVHQILLGAGIPVLETIDLRGVKGGEYTLMCFPLKLVGCDGSPVRAVLL